MAWWDSFRCWGVQSYGILEVEGGPYQQPPQLVGHVLVVLVVRLVVWCGLLLSVALRWAGWVEVDRHVAVWPTPP